MPNKHYGTTPIGPDEGMYDARQGATAYAPIVGAFGALAVTAIVVVFTVSSSKQAPEPMVALCTGLLVIGVFGSLLGSFGLAALGAEKDPTANVAPAIMFVAIPVVLSIVAIFGAFEVLAAIYIPESKTLFAVVTGLAGLFGIVFNAFSVGDSQALHPTDMSPQDFDSWIGRQWIKDRAMAYKMTNRVLLLTTPPAVIGVLLRIFGAKETLTQDGVNWVVGIGVVLSLLGTYLSVNRTRHPTTGNEQIGVKRWEPFVSNAAISLYTLALMVVLP